MAAMGEARVLEGLPFATVLVDPAGLIRELNAAGEMLGGWTAAEAIGKHVAFLVEGLDPLSAQPGIAHAAVIRGRDGQQRQVACTCWRIQSAEPLIGMLLDAFAPDAEMLARLRGLAPGIANEVNTPMQYIGDNARFLMESLNDIRGILSWYQACLRVLAKERHAGLVEEISLMERKIGLDALLDDIPAAILQSLEGVKRVSAASNALKELAESAIEATAVDVNQAVGIALTLSQNQWKSRVDLVAVLGEDTPRVWCGPRALLLALLDLVQTAATWSAAAGATVSVQTRRQGGDAVVEFSPSSVRDAALTPISNRAEPSDLSRSRAALVRVGGSVVAEIGSAGWRFTASIPAFQEGVQGAHVEPSPASSRRPSALGRA